jgi:uncharacterized protein (TIGR01619 family)
MYTLTKESVVKVAGTLLLLFFIFPVARAQKDSWDVYLAQYDEGVGSTTLNMELIKVAPLKELPFVVVTGVTYDSCDEGGLPNAVQIDRLYEISDDIERTVTASTQGLMVGTFTLQCERLLYIYVHDTLTIRNKLLKLYTGKYKKYKYYLGIEPDKKWEMYRTVLYPSQEILDYMSNEKVLERLSDAGDKLEKPREVEHWLYFKNTRDRDLFVKYAEGERFKIESKQYVKDAKLPYQLHMSRVDSVYSGSIHRITIELEKKAKEYKGDYDGWETVVITE